MAEVKEIKSITGDVAFAQAQGRKFTDARNALIAYGVVVLEVSQADMSRETGVDKGDVSRVVKVTRDNPDALAAVKAMSREGARNSRIESAAPVGEAFFRRAKRSSGGGKSEGDSPAGESIKSQHSGLVTGDEADPVVEAIAALYPIALSLDTAGRERLAAAVADALRQANVDARRIASGKEPQGYAVPVFEVAAA